jgi:hypothetical protein
LSQNRGFGVIFFVTADSLRVKPISSFFFTLLVVCPRCFLYDGKRTTTSEALAWDLHVYILLEASSPRLLPSNPHNSPMLRFHLGHALVAPHLHKY